MGSISISVLMIGTLFAAFLIGGVLWIRHMRKPENRHPLDGVRERNVGQALDEAHTDEEGIPPVARR